ncbi:hypothetical protein [Chroococcidiopsis sp.]|uniref:hypothetical protein n=1 Tax=Chroococcidiopsis sp. TaxID=3088168 RepID=UPI003F2C96A2
MVDTPDIRHELQDIAKTLDGMEAIDEQDKEEIVNLLEKVNTQTQLAIAALSEDVRKLRTLIIMMSAAAVLFYGIDAKKREELLGRNADLIVQGLAAAAGVYNISQKPRYSISPENPPSLRDDRD